VRAIFLLLLPLLACSSDPVVAPAGDAASDTQADSPAVKDSAGDAPSDAGSCKLLKPYSSKNVTCNQCAEAKCCVEINGCLGSPDCDDTYVNCILACALLPDDAGDAGIATCMGQCAVDSPKGKAEYDTAIGCADTKCQIECK
jgi:hypothetical protein